MTPISPGASSSWNGHTDLDRRLNASFNAILKGTVPDLRAVSYIHTHPRGASFSLEDGYYAREFGMDGAYLLNPAGELRYLSANKKFTAKNLVGVLVPGYP